VRLLFGFASKSMIIAVRRWVSAPRRCSQLLSLIPRSPVVSPQSDAEALQIQLHSGARHVTSQPAWGAA